MRFTLSRLSSSTGPGARRRRALFHPAAARFRCQGSRLDDYVARVTARVVGGLVLLLIASAPQSFAQAAFGGEVRMSHSLLHREELVDTDEDGELEPGWEYGLSALIRPLLSFGGELYSFTGSVDLSYDLESDRLTADLPVLQLDLYPTPWSLIRVGRFRHLPGTAEFFSPTNYFIRTDFEALLTGDQESYQLPTELLQGTAFFGDFFFRATVSPVRPEMVLPAVNSVWFPEKDLAAVPEEINLGPLLGVYTFRRVYYAEPPVAIPNIDDVSTSFELGGNVAGVDFNYSFYDGWSHESLLQYEIALRSGFVYDVILTPTYQRVQRVGASGAAALGSVRAWADVSLTLGTLLSTERLAGTAPIVVELQEVDLAERVFGVSVELPGLNSYLVAEYKGSSLPGHEEEEVVLPYLYRAAGGRIGFYLSNYTFSPSLTTLVSLPKGSDPSSVFFLDFRYAPTQSLELALSRPIFYGKPTTDFGQYEDIKRLLFSVQARF